MEEAKAQLPAAQEKALDELRRSSESRLGRAVTLETKIDRDGTLRAELRVAEDGSAKYAHLFSVWDEISLHGAASIGKGASEEAPATGEVVHPEALLHGRWRFEPQDYVLVGHEPVTPEETHYAKEVIAKVVTNLEGSPAESRFAATGGRYLGSVPLTEKQKEDAAGTAAYLMQTGARGGEQSQAYRTFARLTYSGKDSGWEARICPAIIKADCDPSAPRVCEGGEGMCAERTSWHFLVRDILERSGADSVRVTFGMLHEIMGVGV